MRSVRLFGKSISLLAIVAIAVSAGMAGAALLSYYGKITTTVEVLQSVLVDGQDYTEPITDVIPEPAPGGENFCFKHTLTNQASIPATVNFETSYWPDNEGITVTYFEPLGYSQYYEVPIDGSDSPLEVTVEDGACHVTWTFDFPVEEWTGNGNLNVGLVIALNGDGNGPAFQIHNHDWDGGPIAAGTWCYTPWDTTIPGNWMGWMTGKPEKDEYQTLVSDLDWVSASGARKADDNPDGILIITISKSKLCEDFHWAAFPTVGSGFNAPVYDDTLQIPSGASWSTPIVNMTYEYAQILGAVTSMTIPSGVSVDFYICYSFDIAIKSGTYKITTTIVPA